MYTSTINNIVKIANIIKCWLIKLKFKLIGLTIEERPIISNILIILDPNIFPNAKPSSFFTNATKEVISSGSDVPNATAVILIEILFIKFNLAEILTIL